MNIIELVKQAKENAKEIKSTLLGVCVVVAALPQNPGVQQLIKMSPKIANLVTTAASIAGAVILIFSVNLKTNDPSKS